MKRLISALLLMSLSLTGFASEESGYFLNMKQKGQLMWFGSIKGNDNNWYSIWISPGYVPPAKYCKKNLIKTKDDFGEYFEKNKYSRLKQDSSDAFRWAFKTCFLNYTLKGTPKAWKNNISKAEQRVSKRLFGWWLAYPWSIVSSVADNVVRIPVGLGGTIMGSVFGGAVIPTYYLTAPTIKGAWDLGVGSIFIPVSGFMWNTLISPPLALFGQQPSESRVDGFWVKKMSEYEVKNLLGNKYQEEKTDVIQHSIEIAKDTIEDGMPY